ncbi:hypothetical protein BGX29_008331 [Mortierella sp. GBA35]|nr:hypothetical protein BGX29_008331 [Mortierella sp. GBA35]
MVTTLSSLSQPFFKIPRNLAEAPDPFKNLSSARSKVNHVPRDDRRYILDVWKGQEWGYSRLESFGFELGYAGAGSIDAGFDDECDAEIATISGTNPVMGWYLHEPHAHSTSVVRSETLRLLFELLEGKEHVRTLTFEEDEYTRSNTRPRPDARLTRRDRILESWC